MTTTITRGIVKDLLPAYLAGEASMETRQLVDAFLRTDDTFALEVAAMRESDVGLPPTAAPPPSAEKRALDAARQRLRHRTSTLVMAVFFTLLPFSFVVQDGEVTFLLFRDAPTIATAWWFTAIVLWIWHVRIRVGTRVSGL
jgi:anti-sigma factor RsiW